jgi:dihydroorotate dehydrogenase electron transfer subunit
VSSWKEGKLYKDSTNGKLSKKAVVTHNAQIAEGIFSMTLAEPEIAAACVPGQFVMISVSDGVEPFLRRPFSVAGMDRGKGTFTLIYQAVGKGSKRLAGWGAGQETDILGPLGNGFSRKDGMGKAVLAGGGMGIAPLLPLAKELRAGGVDVSVFAGARSMDLLFGLHRFNAYGCKVQVATEDGSGGVRGFVTLPLEEHLKKHAPTMLYACGPTPFLKAVAALCGSFHWEAQLSLEERMGCGFGACRGCSIQTWSASGDIVRKRVCVDGPVFAAGEVFPDG